MSKQLSHDRRNTGTLLNMASAIAQRYLKAQSDLPPGKHVESIPATTLTEYGLGGEAVLGLFEKELLPLMSNSAGPRYFGFVTGGSTPASLAGDWLASSLDQNACGSNDSAAPLIEHQTIDLLRDLLGIDPAFFGSFVTGATMSNMVGMSLGRQWVGEQLGIDVSNEGIHALKRIPLYSGTPHSSILKSLSMNGMGRNSLIRVRTIPDREAVDVVELARHLASSPEASIVVANAGTVNTVDFDNLVAIAELKTKYKFWLHVDAAFGGFAAVSPKYQHLVEGINHADSITIDAHKWLNVPYDAAMQFTRHKHLQLKVFQNSAAYLSDPAMSPDFFHYTPENSRRFRALPSWFSLMSYGRDGHRSIVEQCCRLARQLGDWIESSGDYRLLAPVRMNVVCFTFAGTVFAMDEVQRFLGEVTEDGRVFFTPTIYNGTPAIRAAFSNWLTRDEDIEITISVLKDLGKHIKSSKAREPGRIDQIL
jgi:glutamate/tyrosine decarboxylase-like PLP-dependent enzyme